MPDGSNAACRDIFHRAYVIIYATARTLPSRFQDVAGRCFQEVPKHSFCGLTSLRTNSSSLSRISQLTNTGLRSLIFGTCRKAVRYSSNDNLRCRLLTRQRGVENVPSFPHRHLQIAGLDFGLFRNVWRKTVEKNRTKLMDKIRIL